MALAGVVVAGCASSTASTVQPGGATTLACSPSGSITVLAAASLTELFGDARSAFTAAHPCTSITFGFAGSQQLVAQLEQGAPADVLATADTTTMQSAVAAGVVAGTLRAFARNTLQIVVVPGNPRGIRGLQDLARSDIKVVLAAPAVPAGRLAAQALAAAGVTVTPVSQEQDVKGVLGKVALGEADAGIVYRTDVRAAGGSVTGVDIPDAQNQVTTYLTALTSRASNPAVARQFIDYLTSPQAAVLLSGRGFIAP